MAHKAKIGDKIRLLLPIYVCENKTLPIGMILTCKRDNKFLIHIVAYSEVDDYEVVLSESEYELFEEKPIVFATYYSISKKEYIPHVYKWLKSLGKITKYENDELSDCDRACVYLFISNDGCFHFSSTYHNDFHKPFEDLYKLGMPKIEEKEEVVYKIGDRVIAGENNVGNKECIGKTGIITGSDNNINIKYKYYIKFDNSDYHLYSTVTGYAPQEPIPNIKLSFKEGDKFINTDYETIISEIGETGKTSNNDWITCRESEVSLALREIEEDYGWKQFLGLEPKELLQKENITLIDANVNSVKSVITNLASKSKIHYF